MGLNVPKTNNKSIIVCIIITLWMLHVDIQLMMTDIYNSIWSDFRDTA